MIMLFQHRIIAGNSLPEEKQANLALFHQSLQIAVDRPKTDTRQGLPYSPVDLVGTRMGMVPVKRLVNCS
jgi:hypothetical protein